MSAELKTLKLPDGSILHFEEDVAPPATSYLAAAPHPGAAADFKAALESVRTAAGDLFNALGSLPQPPDSCELTFGLKLSTAAGFIIAKAEGEANFGIKLKWTSKKEAT